MSIRSDVNLLGRTLGQVLKEQEGEAFFELVESTRALVREVRAGGDDTELRNILSSLSGADAGFTGPHDSVIGSETSGPVQKFLTERPHRFGVAEGRAELNAVFVQMEGGKAQGVERYRYIED